MKEIELSNGKRVSLPLEDYWPSYLSGIGALGCGYDINGDFASNKSVKSRIIKFNYSSIPTIKFGRVVWWPENPTIQALALQSLETEENSGNNIEEYRTSLNSKTKIDGRYKFFTGSLDLDFDYNNVRTSSNEFYTLRHIQNSWSLNISDFPNVEIEEQAKKDINGTMDPSKLFEKYGTHFIIKLFVGGRLDYSMSLDKNKYKSQIDFRVAAKFSFEKMIGAISAKNETKYSNEIEKINELSNIKINAQGGNESYASSILTNGKDSYEKWVNSVKESPIFIDFDNNSLKAIWSICENEKRKEVLQDYYRKLMESNSNTPIAQTPFETKTVFKELYKCGSDPGSGADDDLEVYRPNDLIINQGWFWMGHYAQSGNDNRNRGTLLTIKPNELLNELITVPPTSFIKIWQHESGGKYYTCWKPIYKDDSFVSLGHILDLAASPEYKDKPHPTHTLGLVCVNIKYVREAELDKSKPIWSDSGSGASESITLYPIMQKEVNSSTVILGTCIGVSTKYPNPKAYLLSLP